jgi:hypothetical protein
MGGNTFQLLAELAGSAVAGHFASFLSFMGCSNDNYPRLADLFIDPAGDGPVASFRSTASTLILRKRPITCLRNTKAQQDAVEATSRQLLRFAH